MKNYSILAGSFCGVDEGLSILKLLASDNKAVQISIGDKNKTYILTISRFHQLLSSRNQENFVINNSSYYRRFFYRLRSLRNIDRISSLELHTVGVVYIALGQTKESEILGNIYGSARYASFLRYPFFDNIHN